jgi:hypothetical protein
MSFIGNREARFFNFKTKECYPKEILARPSTWKLIFNGEDWSTKRVYYASESEGLVICYYVDEKGNYRISGDSVAEKPPQKGRVRILKIGDEIDTVENIWGIYREDD